MCLRSYRGSEGTGGKRNLRVAHTPAHHITLGTARTQFTSTPPPSYILSLLSLSLRVLFLSLFPLPTFSLVLDTCHNEKVQIHILAV